MKQHPILYSIPMVQAILEDRKTMTRRIMKPQIEPCNHSAYQEADWKDKPTKWIERNGYWYCQYCGNGINPGNDYAGIKCPYGQVGDILWVREKFLAWINTKDGSFSHVAAYAADGYELEEGERWRPSIHMPKSACRIWLEITDIKVEKLQDISEEDAIAEGVQENICADPNLCPSSTCYQHGCAGKGEYFRYPVNFDDEPCESAKESFQTLWQSINGRESWEGNPWVWVISFKRIDNPNK